MVKLIDSLLFSLCALVSSFGKIGTKFCTPHERWHRCLRNGHQFIATFLLIGTHFVWTSMITRSYDAHKTVRKTALVDYKKREVNTHIGGAHCRRMTMCKKSPWRGKERYQLSFTPINIYYLKKVTPHGGHASLQCGNCILTNLEAVANRIKLNGRGRGYGASHDVDNTLLTLRLINLGDIKCRNLQQNSY